MSLIYTEARSILGDGLITPSEITRARGLVYSNERLRIFDNALPSAVKQRRTRDQDRLRRVDHPLCCDASAPRLEARSAA